MVYRIFVEKKKELAHEAKALLADARTLLGITNLSDVRVINRYDAENISEELFDRAKTTVFSEPQLDIISHEIDTEGGVVFAVEYLPGQFDQRADSAAQCIQIISQGDRPTVRTAKIYVLYGDLTETEIAEIKKYVINPVEAREATLAKPETLKMEYEIPTTVKTLDGFIELDREGLDKFVEEYSLAMDGDDIAFCQEYFKNENNLFEYDYFRFLVLFIFIRKVNLTSSNYLNSTMFVQTASSIKRYFDNFSDYQEEIN